MMNKSQGKQETSPPPNMGGGMGGGMDIGNLLGMMSGMSSMMPPMGGGMHGMPNQNMSNIQEELNNNTMDGPQGVDTLLETLSSNTKPVYVDKKKGSKKRGLDL